MYRFDYCGKCKHLYQYEEEECSICNVPRYHDKEGPIDKKMKNFFYMADLREIQQSFYRGNFKFHILIVI
jgi:hypothetical protein